MRWQRWLKRLPAQSLWGEGRGSLHPTWFGQEIEGHQRARANFAKSSHVPFVVVPPQLLLSKVDHEHQLAQVHLNSITPEHSPGSARRTHGNARIPSNGEFVPLRLDFEPWIAYLPPFPVAVAQRRRLRASSSTRHFRGQPPARHRPSLCSSPRRAANGQRPHLPCVHQELGRRSCREVAVRGARRAVRGRLSDQRHS